MPISRAKKEDVVAKLVDCFGRAESAVLVDYRQSTVAALAKIRAKLAEGDCELVVAKNTLIKIALEQCGMSLLDSNGNDCSEMLTGMTAVAFGYGAPSKPAQVLLELRKDHENLTFKGGFAGTNPVLGAAGVDRISKMRSKDDAMADLVRILRAAPSRVRTTAGGLVGKLKAFKEVLATEAADAA